MKMAVFWEVASCSLADIDRHCDALMMEAVSSSETSVSIYQTTRRKIPKGSHLYFDKFGEISDSHGREYEGDCLLGCCAA
jgi:hypothetical protein